MKKSYEIIVCKTYLTTGNILCDTRVCLSNKLTVIYITFSCLLYNRHKILYNRCKLKKIAKK